MEQNKKKESEEKLNKINYKLEIEEFNELIKTIIRNKIF